MRYAEIRNARVAHIVEPPNNEATGQPYRIAEMFTAEYVQTLVDITNTTPSPDVGWSYDGTTFAAPPQPTPAQMVAEKTGVVQAHLDATAQGLGYDSIYTAVTYADEPAGPKFQAEGQALRAWRSNVWEKANEILDAIKAGTQPIPDDASLIAALPAFTAPQ